MEEGFGQSGAAKLGEGRGGDAAEGGGAMCSGGVARAGGGRGHRLRHAHVKAEPGGNRNEWSNAGGGEGEKK